MNSPSNQEIDIANAITYIEADVKRLIEIEPMDGPGDCNFPIAIFCLSSIEFLGKIISNKNNCKDQALDYINKYFVDGKNKNQIKDIGRDFMGVFRDGPAHIFFPKFGAGIRRKGDELISKTSTNKIILSTDKFADEFLKSLNRFRYDFNNDKEFRVKIIDNYGNILSKPENRNPPKNIDEKTKYLKIKEYCASLSNDRFEKDEVVPSASAVDE